MHVCYNGTFEIDELDSMREWLHRALPDKEEMINDLNLREVVLMVDKHYAGGLKGWVDNSPEHMAIGHRPLIYDPIWWS